MKELYHDDQVWVLKSEHEVNQQEIKKLQFELSAKQRPLSEQVLNQAIKIQQLELKLKIAIEALEFYADIRSWSTVDNYKNYTNLEYDKDLGEGYFFTNDDTSDDKVSGKKAREALQEIKGE